MKHGALINMQDTYISGKAQWMLPTSVAKKEIGIYECEISMAEPHFIGH